MIREIASRVSDKLGVKGALKAVLPDRLTQAGPTGLCREILDLEARKSDWNLDEIREFAELKKSAWSGLASIAHEIVRNYKPKVVVELGTHMGLSALAMGIALRELNEGGRLFAIDTWEGDEQAGHYGDSVYQQFRSRSSQLRLDEIMVPLRMTFDEAREKVARPIDLLHIDGLHTWDAVKHDFETYRPLVAPGGLVLFHDVNTWFADMRLFWRRLAAKHEHYLIPYSHGLGVIRV